MGWFNQNFVKTKIVSPDLGRIYKKAFEKRQEGDYDDFIDFQEDEVNLNYSQIST